MAHFRSDLEQSRFQLSEGLLRLWEQSDLIDRLFVEGRPTEGAKDLLRTMQKTVDEVRQHIEVLVAAAERREREHQ